jgi:hypothetical protein
MPKEILIIYRNRDIHKKKSEIYRETYKGGDIEKDIQLMMWLYGGKREEYSYEILQIPEPEVG